MVLVRLYKNSLKWSLIRRYFPEWIIRIAQSEKMSRKKLVVHAETSRRRTSGNRTIDRLYDNFDVQTIYGSRVAMKVLSGGLVGELQVGKSRMGTTSFVS